jgi:hypothetical protein
MPNGHHAIEEYDIWSHALGKGESLVRRRRDFDLEARVAEGKGKDDAAVLVVVDEQHDGRSGRRSHRELGVVEGPNIWIGDEKFMRTSSETDDREHDQFRSR